MIKLKPLLFTNQKTKALVANASHKMLKSTAIQEQKLNLKGQTVNYVKTGSGTNTVFCFPGALGTIWSDFKPQVEKLDKNKFTIVAWDPPGYGNSRPPNRQFSTEFYKNDAKAAVEFMKALGIEKYSLLGWSDGGISSMILAATKPEVVQKLVIWGANSYVISEEIQSYEKIRDISKWSERMRQPLVEMYGYEGFQKLWNDWCDAMSDIYKSGGNICKDLLSEIKSPTLILHGDKDPMVANEHPEFLAKHIKGSRLHRFPEGKHNVHLKYADEFNKIITNFLLE